MVSHPAVPPDPWDASLAEPLQGRTVRLERLADRHAEDLAAAGSDERIWTYMPRRRIASVAESREMIRGALASARDGSQAPFAIVLASSGRAIGSTRYLDIRREHRGHEIGWTWIAPEHQRTAVNTECKLLLLRRAFEELLALRVQLKTDLRNLKSQRAIERIGGRKEGVLRSHMVMPDGYLRDTVMYSITA